MSKYQVTQMRSGEGWILTEPSNVDASVLAGDLDELAQGWLLVASEEFKARPPQGGERLDAELYAFRGDAAKAMLRNWKDWGARRGLFAFVPELPDADARRRWIADATRPWDPERLKATVYGQVGRDWAIRGLWFATERDRARYLETAVASMLKSHGVARLPNGDVTIVLELPTDSSFDATFETSGSGESLVIAREFPARMMSRTWTIRRGSWEAEEKRASARKDASWKYRLTQGLVSAIIVVISIPMFLTVALVALITKLTGSSTTVSSTQPRSAR